MVLWIATVFAQIWFGFEICLSFLDPGMSCLLVAAMGVPAGIGVSSIVFYVSAVILGQNILHVVLHTACLLLVSFAFVTKRLKRKKKLQINKRDLWPVIAYFLVSLWLCAKIYFPRPQTLSLAIDTHIVEEVSLHSSFYVGVNSGHTNPFHIHHPNFAGRYVVSHWLTAFHSSMLRVGFASMRSAMVVPSALLITSFCITISMLAVQFHVPFYIAVCVPFLSIFVSGFGFLRILTRERRTSRTNDYVSQSGYGKLTRFHPVLHVLLSFRHTTLALPLVCSAIYVLYWCAKLKHTASKWMLPMTGLIVGFVLPATQHQSFIGMIIFYAIYSCLQLIQKRFTKEMRGFGLMMLIGFTFHLPRYLNRQFISEAFSLGTMWEKLVNQGEFVPSFSVWWNMTGMFIVVVLLLSWFKLSAVEYNLFIPCLGCFVVLNFWKMQLLPEYNILPIYTLFYPVGSVVFAATLYRFVMAPSEPEARGAFACVSVVITLSIVISSIMGIYRQTHNIKPMWGHSEEHLVDWLLRNTPKDAVFLAPLIAMNPVSLLAGRTCYLEKTEVLNHIGCNATVREYAYMRFLETNITSDLSTKVDYFVKMIDNTDPPEDIWREVYSYRDYAVYKIK